jgi:hypothetical protein
MGTLKIEITGETHEELQRQLESVMLELRRIIHQPGLKLNLGSIHAWKVVGAPQAWKTVAVPQAWKVVGSPQAWKTVTSQQPGEKVNLVNPQAWIVTYET